MTYSLWNRTVNKSVSNQQQQLIRAKHNAGLIVKLKTLPIMTAYLKWLLLGHNFENFLNFGLLVVADSVVAGKGHSAGSDLL